MTRRMLHGRRRVLAVVAVAGTLTLGMSACVSAEDTTAELHGSVVQIAERAAAEDFAGALAALALLDRDVTAAVDAGRLDTDREQQIRAAMELVRADLEAAEVAVSPSAEPEPAPEPDPAPEPQPAPDDEPDNSGPGNNNGNGNGNNGNNGNGNNGKGNG